MLMTFTNRLNLSTSQEALLSRDVQYYSRCYRIALAAQCLALRTNEPINLPIFLKRFKLTSRQAGSIQYEVEQDIANARENLTYRKSSLKIAIEKRESALTEKRKYIEKQVKANRDFLKSNKGRNGTQWLRGKEQALRLKQLELAEINDRLEKSDYSITVGSKALLRKRTSREGVSKSFNLKEWRDEWSEKREFFRYAVGDKNKPFGNAEIQYKLHTNTVRIRLTDLIANERLTSLPKKDPRLPAKFIEIAVTPFELLNKTAAKLGVLPQELLVDKPVTARIFRRDGEYFIAISADIDIERLSPQIPKSFANTLGLDFNANGIAWAVVKPDGNPLSNTRGFIEIPEMTDHSVSTALSRLFKDAEQFGVARVAIENLDFFEKKSHMRSGANGSDGRQRNRMLSTLAYANYSELVLRKCAKLGLRVSLINPRYSSVAGFIKFAFKHNTSADIGAAIMIGRQSLYGTVYRKRGDMPHVARNKLFKEDVRASLPNYLTNQRKSQDSIEAVVNLTTWHKTSSTLGIRSLWRCRFKKSIADQGLMSTAVSSTGRIAHPNNVEAYVV